MPTRFILILASVAAFPMLMAGVSAHAQQATWLTEENVRQYVNEAEASPRLPYDEHLAFVKRSTHDAFKGKMDMTIKMPSQPPVHSPTEITKESMIASAREGHDSMQGADISVDIQDIKISPDKKTATVKSEMRITNQQIKTGENLQTTLADSVTNCSDEVVYTPMVGVQIINSDCKSEITVKQEQEL